MMPLPEQPTAYHIIGISDVYEKVISLSVKVDVLLAQHADNSKDIGDHETRLRLLERGRWPLPALTAVIAVAALIVSFVKLG